MKIKWIHIYNFWEILKVLEKSYNRLASFFTAIKYRKHIIGKGQILHNANDHFYLKNNSILELNGQLFVGANAHSKDRRSCVFRLEDNSKLSLHGNFKFMYDADVILFKGAELVLGKDSFINSNCKIRCHNKISIGDGCAISHDFTVMDSDVHKLNGTISKGDVIIGNHDNKQN